jgi:peptidoglycan/LPS O-acetylase OafA/YrhL
MVRLCGASLGLFAFAIAILLGLLAGNPTPVILSRALWALLIFCVIGLIAGWVGYRVLDEHALQWNREMFSESDDQEDAAASAGNRQAASEESEASVPNQAAAGG